MKTLVACITSAALMTGCAGYDYGYASVPYDYGTADSYDYGPAYYGYAPYSGPYYNAYGSPVFSGGLVINGGEHGHEFHGDHGREFHAEHGHEGRWEHGGGGVHVAHARGSHAAVSGGYHRGSGERGGHNGGGQRSRTATSHSGNEA